MWDEATLFVVVLSTGRLDTTVRERRRRHDHCLLRWLPLRRSTRTWSSPAPRAFLSDAQWLLIGNPTFPRWILSRRWQTRRRPKYTDPIGRATKFTPLQGLRAAAGPQIYGLEGPQRALRTLLSLTERRFGQESHSSSRFRRERRHSETCDSPQNVLKQLPGNGHLRHLERHVAGVPHDLRSDLDQLFP
jgi:hypothetical protein